MKESVNRLDFEELSNQFTLKQLTEADIPDLYHLCVSNPRYYSYLKCEPDPETLKGELIALPPGRTLEDKYFAGIYRDGRMIAILDLITGYPNPRTAFIGWFMVDSALQGNGIGRGFIAELCVYLKNSGFDQIRLGCIEDNAEGRRFWERNGFCYTGNQYSTEHYTVLVLQKSL